MSDRELTLVTEHPRGRRPVLRPAAPAGLIPAQARGRSVPAGVVRALRRRGPLRARTSGCGSTRSIRDWAFEGGTGRGVTVAIVDSGLETDHPALQGRVVESVAVEMVDGEPNVVEGRLRATSSAHGTACGSIILGLAPEVDLVSVRVLGADLRARARRSWPGWSGPRSAAYEVANLSLSSKSETLFP